MSAPVRTERGVGPARGGWGRVEQSELIEVLSEFARTLATDFPVQHILDRLVDRVAGVLPGLSAGVTLIDSDLAPRYVAASTEAARTFELVQTRLGQGPCLEAYTTGEAVLVPDLARQDRFPSFAAAGRDAGLCAVFAFPLRQGDAQIGALDLYRARAGPLETDELAAAQTLADVAAAYLLNAQARYEVRRVADHFQHTSLHDPLTGLPNRALLQERLEHLSARAQRSHARSAVLSLDVDRFQQVNDAHGHDVGDQLLVAVADRLLPLVRAGDTLARLAGDEFVLLCEDVDDPAAAENLAGRLTQAFGAPFVVDGLVLPMTASVGLALSAGDDEHSTRLLSRADAARHEAKRRGIGRHVIDLTGDGPVTDDRSSLGADLQAALTAGQLDVAYQPVVRMTDGELCGVEALVRWDRGGRGPVAAEVLVDVAEQQGLISRIGLWVLERACTDAVERHRRCEDAALTVAVNVSTAQLLGPGFCSAVERVVADTDMDPAELLLEVTEGVVMQDPLRAAAVLADLRALGVRTALDDFGTGFSSLSYLRLLPIDTVKIDRAFVSDVTTATGRAIVAAVSDLAHVLGMAVTAEGVETPAQRDALAEVGCDAAQGFLFAPPMSASALVDAMDAAPHGRPRLPLDVAPIGEAVLASPLPWPSAVAVPRQRATASFGDLGIAGLYVPAGRGPEPIAGDFFEVLRLENDVIALLVGDVAGHGVQAVGRMRRLRARARAYALERHGPAPLLGHLDTLLERDGQEEFATLWYGEYRPGNGMLAYANAGHPPPALHLQGRVQLLEEADAPALGTGLAHALATERAAFLAPGAVLVAYSDGLIERRRADFEDQLGLLKDVVHRACDPTRSGTPETIAAEVLDALIPNQAQAEDDVCLLVVRRHP